MYHFETKIPLFDEITLHLVICDDIKTGHIQLGVPYEKQCCQHGGECHMEDRELDVWIFWQPACLTHDWIAHEIHHAACNIQIRVGIEPSDDNDEVGARLVGFIHGWLYRLFEEKGIKILHDPQE